METINGIGFEDWAAACGQISQGMSEERVCEILATEKPLWKEAMELWSDKLGDMMAEDMEIATQYGNIFANPNVGKFATTGEVEAIDDLLAIAPDLASYYKIFWHQSVAAKYGIDSLTVLEEYGLTIGQFGQLNMHYIARQNEYLHEDNPDQPENQAAFQQLLAKWEQHFEAYYADEKVDLASDIEF